MANAQAVAIAEHLGQINRATGIPTFFGDSSRDTLTADQMINRIEAAGRMANWGDPRKCQELQLALREKALLWYEGLATMHDNFNFEQWEAAADPEAGVKIAFLKAFLPRYTPRTKCLGFLELKQKGGEDVQSFADRVSSIFRQAFSPNQLPVALRTFNNPAAAAPHHADDADAAADAQFFYDQGSRKMQRHFMATMFLGGLREDIRTEIIKDTDQWDMAPLLDEARSIETALAERKGKEKSGTFISSVEEVNNQEEHIAAVVRKTLDERRSKPITCYNCQKKGHYARDCRQPKRETEQSSTKHINAIQSETKAEHQDNGKEAEDTGDAFYWKISPN